MRSMLLASTLLATLLIVFSAGPAASQTGQPLPTATPSPAQPPEINLEVTLREGQPATFQMLSQADAPGAAQLRPKSIRLPEANLPPQAQRFVPPPPDVTAADGDLVDNWQRIYDEDFEGQFPDYPPC